MSLVTGLGAFIGATIVAAIVILILSKVFENSDVQFLNDLLDLLSSNINRV